MTDEDVATIEELGRQGGLFDRLASSIAPEIYGMLDVKKVCPQDMQHSGCEGTVCVCVCRQAGWRAGSRCIACRNVQPVVYAQLPHNMLPTTPAVDVCRRRPCCFKWLVAWAVCYQALA